MRRLGGLGATGSGTGGAWTAGAGAAAFSYWTGPGSAIAGAAPRGTRLSPAPGTIPPARSPAASGVLPASPAVTITDVGARSTRSTQVSESRPLTVTRPSAPSAVTSTSPTTRTATSPPPSGASSARSTESSLSDEARIPASLRARPRPPPGRASRIRLSSWSTVCCCSAVGRGSTKAPPAVRAMIPLPGCTWAWNPSQSVTVILSPCAANTSSCRAERVRRAGRRGDARTRTALASGRSRTGRSAPRR